MNCNEYCLPSHSSRFAVRIPQVGTMIRLLCNPLQSHRRIERVYTGRHIYVKLDDSGDGKALMAMNCGDAKKRGLVLA